MEQRPGVDAEELRASFLVLHEAEPELARAAVGRVLAIDSERDYAHYLRATLEARLGDAMAARRAIADALRLKPGKALYLEFERNL